MTFRSGLNTGVATFLYSIDLLIEISCISSDIFIEFSSSVYSTSEGNNVAVLVITKSGETQEDIDVVVSLQDGSARGKEEGESEVGKGEIR